MSNYALAVDIGGTFTDVVVRSAAGRAWVDKTLTTPDNLDTGLFRGCAEGIARQKRGREPGS